jgi:hypothetical protein
VALVFVVGEQLFAVEEQEVELLVVVENIVRMEYVFLVESIVQKE